MRFELLLQSLLMPASLIAVLALPAPAQMLINEFNTGTPDYQELVNCSSAPVDLGGWTSTTWYATSATGAVTIETPVIFPTGTVVAPGGYLVLQENGTLGQPGSLPSSYSQGFNYFWTNARTLEFALVDAMGQGVDYVYLNWYGNPPTPNLPAGTFWTGSLDSTSGSGDEVYRNSDIDTDDAMDWTKSNTSSGPGTPAALNPGQTGPTCGGGPSPFTLAITGSLAGDLTIDVTGIPMGTAEGWNFISADTLLPAGTGPVFGINPDALSLLLFQSFPFPTVGHPFHWLGGFAGVHPQVPYSFAPGTMTGLSGTSLDFMTLGLDAGFNFTGFTNVVRYSVP